MSCIVNGDAMKSMIPLKWRSTFFTTKRKIAEAVVKLDQKSPCSTWWLIRLTIEICFYDF